MATIYDIAKAAGVTPTTVSKVLSGKGSISAATRARVMQYAQELHYQPNLVARSLIKGRTSMIGLISQPLDNPFAAELATALEQPAYAAGLRVLINTLSVDDEVGQRMLKDLLLRRVDGLLVVTGTLAPESGQLITTSQLPAIYCLNENDEDQFTPVVTFDFRQGGALAAEHLLALGHRHMGIVTPMSKSCGWGHLPRVTGFQETLARSGLIVQPEFIAAGQSVLEEGKEAGYHLLNRSDRPTAIFATNDLQAIGVISAAWELGLQVPRDLSVVGLDNISLARYTLPPLTTVAIDKPALMTKAVGLLLRAIEGQSVSSPPLQPATLVVRGSTAPPPASQ